jgi:hypothetical protein
MAENYDIEIDPSDYEHETNDVAKEQENSWQRVKKRREETQHENPTLPQSHQQNYKIGITR